MRKMCLFINFANFINWVNGRAQGLVINMDAHITQIRECIKIVKNWYDLEILDLWANEKWQVEKI